MEPSNNTPEPDFPKWKTTIRIIIFEADTFLGKFFDISLLVLIIFSVLAVLLESVESYSQKYGQIFYVLEWVITIIFSLEYILRLMIVKRPLSYAFSFFGVIDLISILPTFMSLFFSGTQSLLVIRSLRLLRVFRIFKVARYLIEAKTLLKALKASVPKISIFLGATITLVIIMGTLMYLIEGSIPNSTFTSIPKSMYWAIVTLSTVGYGDIAPQTPAGQCLASFLMLIGYGMIAVPTGIVSVELSRANKNTEESTHCCPTCSREGHEDDAHHCKYCGAKL